MTFDLVTFGDSWTKGCGVGYEKGMSQEEYDGIFNNTELGDQYAYRAVLAKKWGCKNINFSCMGSSNMRQFRHAIEFFKSKPERRTVVLWATTSIFRHEVWMNKRKKGDKGYINLIYNHEYNLLKCKNEVKELSPFNSDTLWKVFKSKPEKQVKSAIVRGGVDIDDHIINHHDKENELRVLSNQMDHWNLFFDLLGVENYWIDTDITHEYESVNPRMLFKDKPRRDLLSMLVQDNEVKLTPSGDQYERKCKASRLGLVSPYSGHPTKESHIKIADMIDEEINLINNIR
jgi:hypothetical protein